MSEKYQEIVKRYFFFFKQKTAYEMRISDWSSDVCFSDLFEAAIVADIALAVGADGRTVRAGARRGDDLLRAVGQHPRQRAARDLDQDHRSVRHRHRPLGEFQAVRDLTRSEEHTYELQSLMRIAYGVYCLKKTTIYNN